MENHQAEAIVITCIDFRFQEYINNWISENFQAKTYDRGAFAGAAKNLDTILSQIEVAHRLHKIKKVVLINHEDCGAYGKENFPDSQSEHQKHAADLKESAFKIKQKYPDLEVKTYYLHLDGTFETIG